jgi:hypothetical protein
MIKDEFQITLQSWLQENGEVLIDIYLHHSGGGGTLYLLKSPTQAQTITDFAISLSERYGDGRATITAFRSGYYPLRERVDESFIEKMKATWQGERWYSIAKLEDVFPEPLSILGSGDTREELESDLADIVSRWTGHFVGFGENPFDSSDWAVRYHAEVIETTIGTFIVRNVDGK